jgi:hypothetical protein
MFRSERQVALDDLQRACRRTAESYEEDAAIVGVEPVAELFRELAAQRERLADRLAQQQKRLGDLPSGTDTDQQTLSELKDRLQAHMADAGFQAVIENRLANERDLRELAEHALEMDLPTPTRHLLNDVKRQAEQGARRLQAARDALQRDAD